MLRKIPKPSLVFFCALFGMGYFNAFSSLDVNPVLKNVLVLLPIQLGLVIYFLWFRCDDRDPENL